MADCVGDTRPRLGRGRPSCWNAGGRKAILVEISRPGISRRLRFAANEGKKNMCGVAGFVGRTTEMARAETLVADMTAAQHHRGPDDGGVAIVHKAGPAVIFGHRRLSIIDLTSAGHQPMVDPETGNWITFNGEIYNYAELREELRLGGMAFRTATDTEVILKAYSKWGPESVARLNGIFGFGIWDQQRQYLFLARDHLGVKPVYYWHDENCFLFASEVRAVLASELVPRQLDLGGLNSYLAYGSVQEPLTLVQGIQSLLPGHTLTWSAGNIATERYWRLPDARQVQSEAPRDTDSRTKERLAEAVRLQLVADVPLGAFLSGGIDSTAIAALAQSAASGPIKTFSIVFDEKVFDESLHARTAAQHIGTDHTELRLTGAEVLTQLPTAVAAFDQPSTDGLNTYFVSKATREGGLTVALSGVGGDELFAGYGGYRKALMAERWANQIGLVPSRIRYGLAGALGSIARTEKLRQFATLIQWPEASYFATRRVFSPWQIRNLIGPDSLIAQWNSRFAHLAEEAAGYDTINRISALELQTYMLSTLLRDTDQMSMAHALEVRVPFLDYKLVEHLFTLPGKCKIDPQRPKPLLTRSLNGAIPDECVFRPKRGFELPFAVWLKGNLRSEVKGALFSPNRTAPLRSAGLREIWEGFEQGKLNWSRVWTLYVLIKWLETHRIA